jgi:hypothetical protein
MMTVFAQRRSSVRARRVIVAPSASPTGSADVHAYHPGAAFIRRPPVILAAMCTRPHGSRRAASQRAYAR